MIESFEDLCEKLQKIKCGSGENLNFAQAMYYICQEINKFQASTMIAKGGYESAHSTLKNEQKIKTNSTLLCKCGKATDGILTGSDFDLSICYDCLRGK
jgi:hypothetical protein